MSATVRTSNFAMVARLQFLARGMLVVMLVTWVAAFYPFDDLLDRQGTPLGADFSMFYAAGMVARDDAKASLYEQAAHQQQLHELFPNLRPEFCLPYRYPPFVAELMSAFTWLPYWMAYALFVATSLAIWIVVLRAMYANITSRSPIDADQHRSSAMRNKTIWYSLAAWPIALETLIGGQASMIGLAIVAASLLLVRHRQYIAAGAVLALAAYKPNVLALFAVGLACRYPRVLFGAVPVALLLAGVTCWRCGLATCDEYFVLLTQLSGNSWDVSTPFWKMQGIESWVALLIPANSRKVTVVMGLLLSIAAGVGWRYRKARESSSFAEFAVALLAINALFNPYTPIYDLVLLAPAVVFGAERCFGQSANRMEIQPGMIQLVLGLLFFGPHISQAVTKIIGLQLFPILLLWIVAWFMSRCWSSATEEVQPDGHRARSGGLAASALLESKLLQEPGT